MSRINDYLPKILQDILELKKTNESLDVELENISNNIDTINKETIVATATLYGIKKWEKVLGINPKEGESLDVRRFRIQNILTNKLPFTYRWLVNKLKEITGSESGFTLDISYDDYEITIVLSGLDVDIMAEVQKQLRIAVPANMELLISGPQIQSSEIKVGIGMMYGTKYKIKSAKTGLPAGKNLLKIKTSDLIANRYINAATGEITSSATGNYDASTEYAIFVMFAGETVTFSDGLEVAFYKSDKTFIKYIDRNKNRTQVVPDDCYYIRIDVYKINRDTMQIEKGSEQTSYEPFIEL